MSRLKTEYDQGHVGGCTQLAEYAGTRVDDLRPITAYEVKQRTNDINANSDGPARIQTATGGDKPRTAGGTPTPNYHTHKEATEERGR